jgi:hypothetical protein
MTEKLPGTAGDAHLRALRRAIARRKTWDWLFALGGVLALVLALLVFAMLFGQMLKNGLPHLSLGLLHAVFRRGARQRRHPFGVGRHDRW